MSSPLRILMLTNRMPYEGIPGGYAIVSRRIVELARRGHQIGLATFERDETPRQVQAMCTHLFELERVPPPPPRSFSRRVADYLLAPEPARFRDGRSKAMKQCIGQMVERSHYHVVMAEFVRTGQYLFDNPWLPAVRRVISCHRSPTLMKLNEIEALAHPPLSWLQRLRIRGMATYELNLYKHMDHVFVLTASERLRTLTMSPQARVTVVPSGVDTRYFTHDPARQRQQAILFTGSFKDASNEDAVLWFIEHAWPLLKKQHPQLTFHVVGPHPTAAMHQCAKRESGIHIVGGVTDLRDYLYTCAAFICPVRIGAGLRTKVLEAMASGIPVVSTVLGVEGIPAHVGENCLLADRADLMAQNTSQLLCDGQLAAELARNARSMIEERFNWDISIDRLEQAPYRISGHGAARHF